MNRLITALKLAGIVALNIFLFSAAGGFLLENYGSLTEHTLLESPAWVEWTMRVSGFVLLAMVGVGLSYLLNRELLKDFCPFFEPNWADFVFHI